MSGTYRALPQDPDELADVLESWALQREKILHMLDPRAARSARQLARRCRDLIETSGGPLGCPMWAIEWRLLRGDAMDLLYRPADPITIEVEEEPTAPSRRPTLIVEMQAVDNDECPTRAHAIAWPEGF